MHQPRHRATPQGTCNNNQFSDPFTAPDGTLYVTFANFNNTVTGKANRNQVLLGGHQESGRVQLPGHACTGCASRGVHRS